MNKKFLAPVIIVGIILTWIVYQAFNLITIFRVYGEQIPAIHKYVLIAVIFCFSIALVYVLFQRIDELKKEDKNDLEKY